MLHKMSEDIEDVCPECGAEGEDIDHLLKCESPRRNKIRDHMFKEIGDYMKSKNTPVEVHAMIITYLRAWFSSSLEEIHQDPNISKFLKSAVGEQMEIGWDQFLLGRISKKWGELINFHQPKNNKENDKVTKEKAIITLAETWGARMVPIIWKHLLEIWATRNGKAHGETKEEQHSIYKKKLLQKIAKIKAKANIIPEEKVEYITAPIETIERMNTQQILIAWIRHSEIIITVHRGINRKIFEI